MRIKTNNTLEYNIVLEHLSEMALSEKAKERLMLLKPFLKESECKSKMRETTEAVKTIEGVGHPPLAYMKELDKILDLTEKGSMLIPDQLNDISSFIHSCKRMKSYLKRAETLSVDIAYYGGAINELSELFNEIDRSIRNGVVDNNATTVLRDIRRKIDNTNNSIKNKLESILRGNKGWFADGYVTSRNGRFVLPVKREYKNSVSGTVVDTSSTGSTCFIEPSSVRKLQEELTGYEIDEDNEVRKILYTLTALVHEYMNELNVNTECMESLDFIFAKAKLSIEMKAIPVPVIAERKIKIIKGRHPLLNHDICVPLDFEIGEDINGIIITGPNTGGKTVALKTVGLLSLMAQSGLHVPAAEGSIFSMHSNVLCDIGDGQSITENLSTFSSHITNVIDILKNVSNESLVLLDELGSGTDPAEGMGIAVSILDELRQRGCLFVATTHYPEIKDYALKTDKLINARMEFDKESLRPLYKLVIGEAGESCALYIARRLGFPEHMLKRAHKEAYGNRNILESDIPEMEFENVEEEISYTSNLMASDRIQKDIPKKVVPNIAEKFNMGDSVMVSPEKVIGIVYKTANEKGEFIVQIKGKKQNVSHKRLKLITPANELYPDDYDFSIVFDTVENRKARHIMGKRYDADLVIECED